VRETTLKGWARKTTYFNGPRQYPLAFLIGASLRAGKALKVRKVTFQEVDFVKSRGEIQKCSVRTSQETHCVSATKNNRFMLFRETVVVYCENHTEHTDTVRTSQETHCLRYKAQPVNDVWGNSRCLL
jgi:hypothetical protein